MQTAWYQPFLKPAARKPAVVVDLDGTIAREDDYKLSGNGPIPGAKEALQRLRDAGYDIVIYTCRMNKKGRPRYIMQLQKTTIEDWLDRNGIPYTRVEDDYNGKPRGQFYLDNRAIRVNDEGSWDSAVKEILGEEPRG